jgi:leucyl aminopeptidase
MTLKDILKLLDPKNHNLPKIKADSAFKKYDVLYIPVFEEDVKDLIKAFPGLKKLKLKGNKKESFDVVEKGQSWRIRGMGKKEKMDARKIRRMAGSMYTGSLSAKPASVGIMIEPEWAEMAALGIHVAALNPGMYKPKYKKEPVPEVGLIHQNFKAKAAAAKNAILRGQNTAQGKNLMRLLGALPPNRLSTEAYADVIQALAKQWKVKCKRASKQELKKYELLNAVSAGSGHDSQLLIITLDPKKGKTKDCNVVVGKGICFDAGGTQSKGNYMKTMKEDMAGSASVLGTVLSIVKNNRNLRKTTHFMLPLAENMMGDFAMRPDDVYTAGDGQTVEIVHTDAEGRLVMADAICYAKNNYKNIKEVYTIATLTGSCIIALGELYTGVVCNDEELSGTIEQQGKAVGELSHVGPWDEEYDDNNSPIADVANLGEKDRDAGWIKAGMFLHRFVPQGKDAAKFCHFDIAGSIDMKGAGNAWRKKGFSSGVGVGLLSELLTK